MQARANTGGLTGQGGSHDDVWYMFVCVCARAGVNVQTLIEKHGSDTAKFLEVACKVPPASRDFIIEKYKHTKVHARAACMSAHVEADPVWSKRAT